jgi:hypothetical protein
VRPHLARRALGRGQQPRRDVALVDMGEHQVLVVNNAVRRLCAPRYLALPRSSGKAKPNTPPDLATRWVWRNAQAVGERAIAALFIVWLSFLLFPLFSMPTTRTLPVLAGQLLTQLPVSSCQVIRRPAPAGSSLYSVPSRRTNPSSHQTAPEAEPNLGRLSSVATRLVRFRLPTDPTRSKSRATHHVARIYLI